MSEVQAVISSLVIETFQMLTLFFTICGRLVCVCGGEKVRLSTSTWQYQFFFSFLIFWVNV